MRPTIEDSWETHKYKVLMAGMGNDTVNMIAQLYLRGYEPDEVIFVDTGSEFPHTYNFVEHLRVWMQERKWSKLTILQRTNRHGEPISVIQEAEKANTLPSAAFGFKSCSVKFKVEPVDKYMNNNPNAWEAWGVAGKGVSLDKYTGKVLKLVGINADEAHRIVRWKEEHKYTQVYPLVDWGIGEDKLDVVEECGLYYAGKSSCVCCPHITKAELEHLRDVHPSIFDRLIHLERNYITHNLKSTSSTKGLCRSYTIQDKLNTVTASTSCDICHHG